MAFYTVKFIPPIPISVFWRLGSLFDHAGNQRTTRDAPLQLNSFKPLGTKMDVASDGSLDNGAAG